jgi:hypothetical protein
MRIYLFERDRLSELLVPDLPASWREWIATQAYVPEGLRCL